MKTSEKHSTFDRLNIWMKKSITLRLFTIVILTLILMIPIARVKDLIREREWRQIEAESEVSQKWGGGQNITGPILSIPYFKHTSFFDIKSQQHQIKTEKHFAHFLPEELDVNASTEPYIKNRGIFEIVLYKALVHLNGHFVKPDFSDWNIAEEDIIWEDAILSLGLSELRGINESVEIDFDSEKLQFEPGLECKEVTESGVSIRIDAKKFVEKETIEFDTELRFNGSKHLYINPLGKTTKMEMESSWKDPKFTGGFLPMEHKILESGFTADWKVLNLNRSFPQKFIGRNQDIGAYSFGVDFIMPVDQYQKSMRSVKYALLLISLTFLLFFFVQIIKGVRIHPIQYLIVGMALCLYYVLLIALSEHLSFSKSYIIATCATITMITFYINSFFKSRRLTMTSFYILGSVYLFIYIILNQQDYALLIGSIGLFAILGIVMYLSQRIDWFEARKAG